MSIDFIAQNLFLIGLLMCAATVFVSSRACVRYERKSAFSRVKDFRGVDESGRTFLDGGRATIRPGTEQVTYGLFALQHYSRRFLVQDGDDRFLVVVTMGVDRPYVKQLDERSSELVAGFKEWGSGVA